MAIAKGLISSPINVASCHTSYTQFIITTPSRLVRFCAVFFLSNNILSNVYSCGNCALKCEYYTVPLFDWCFPRDFPRDFSITIVHTVVIP